MPVEFHSRVFPSQHLLGDYYSGGPDDFAQELYGLVTQFGDVRLPTEEFDLVVSDRIPVEEMASNPVALRFLGFLAGLVQPRRVLEIGSFIGLSSMTMAKPLAPGATVTTLERFDHVAEIARENFARNGFADRIELIEGDAFEIIEGFAPDTTFDLIFLDGNKDRYDDYFRMLDPHLAPGGLFLVDDVFFHGDALHEDPFSEKGRGVRRFLELAAATPGYDRTIVPISNGLMLMRKYAA